MVYRVTLSLFILLIVGCNSKVPSLSRIKNVEPFMLQMGSTTTILGAPLSRYDECLVIEVDSKDESIYCAGVTFGDIAEPNADPSGLTGDAFIIKFNRKKEIAWGIQLGAVTFAGMNAGNQLISDLAIDTDGSIIAVGSHIPPGYPSSKRPLLLKLSRDGDILNHIVYSSPVSQCDLFQIWNHRYFCAESYPLSSSLKIFEIFLDGTSNVINELPNPNTYALDFKMDEAGNFYTVGSVKDSLDGICTSNDTYDDGYVRKIDPNGTQIYVKQYCNSTKHISGIGLAVSPEGDLIFAGTLGSNTFVSRFRQSGTSIIQLWNHNINHTGINAPNSILLARNGDVYVGGDTKGNLFEENPDADYDAFIMRIGGLTGLVKSARQFGTSSRGTGNNNKNQSCFSLREDFLGNILCGGSTQGDTAETRGGTGPDRDIMIWRVGPNLEF